MNKELIMEIANKSGMLEILKDHAAEYGNGTLENTPYLELEKFAELIVRECVMFIDVGASKFSDGEWLRSSIRDIGDMIKEHLGVEE